MQLHQPDETSRVLAAQFTCLPCVMQTDTSILELCSARLHKPQLDASAAPSLNIRACCLHNVLESGLGEQVDKLGGGRVSE